MATRNCLSLSLPLSFSSLSYFLSFSKQKNFETVWFVFDSCEQIRENGKVFTETVRDCQVLIVHTISSLQNTGEWREWVNQVTRRRFHIMHLTKGTSKGFTEALIYLGTSAGRFDWSSNWETSVSFFFNTEQVVYRFSKSPRSARLPSNLAK